MSAAQTRSLAIRHLAPRQVESLLSSLQTMPGHQIGFEFVAGDPEATQFAAQLIGLFQRAGWFVEKVSEIPAGATFGIRLLLNPFEAQVEHAIRDALASVGIDVGVQTREDYPLERITLLIGHRSASSASLQR